MVRSVRTFLAMNSFRTPSSLKWLIDKRARLLGALLELRAQNTQQIVESDAVITVLEKRLAAALQLHEDAEAQFQEKENQLISRLSAIDMAMSMHEIQISPEKIPPRRTQKAVRIFDHGDITRGIYKALKAANDKPLSAMEVVFFLIAEYGLDLHDDELKIFRRKIRKRLQHLAWEGKLSPIHESITRKEGRWRLIGESLHLHFPRAGIALPIAAPPAGTPVAEYRCQQET